MARHARPELDALAHPALRSARRSRPRPPARPGPPVLGGGLERVPAFAVIVLATVVLGGAFGLVLTDGGPSAAYVATPPADVGRTVASPPTSHPAPTATTGDTWPTATLGGQPPGDEPGVRPPVSAPPTASEIVAEPGWAGVLGHLDAVRSEAFGLGDLALLTTVYVTGSDPLERDAAALVELAGAGVRAEGLRLVVDEAAVVDAGDDEVVLRVVDRMPGYRLVRADGSVVEVRAGRGPATWFVTLVGGEGTWRIAEISAA